MKEQSLAQIEGRLNAQREFLARLLAWIMSQADSEDLLYALREQMSVQDHSEDPGVIADTAFAIEAAAALEAQMLLERAKSIRSEA